VTSRIYVDWSGDPGFRFRQGSSELLLIATVLSDEEVDVEPLRKRLSLPAHYEFHFTNTDQRIRDQFRNYINSELEIPSAAVLRVHKQFLQDDFRKKRGEQLISEFIALCIQYLPMELVNNATLIYDGKKEQKSFRNVLRRTLSQSLKPVIFIRDVKAVPANKSDGLQVADMLAGFVRTDLEWIQSQRIKIIEYPP